MLWPDTETSGAIRALWDTLAEISIPSIAVHTHRLHQPHVSLAVAEVLPVEETLKAVGRLPTARIPLSIEAVGVFPGGILYLACVVNQELLDEQRRVQLAVAPLAVHPWPYFDFGAWVPHVTMGYSLSQSQLAVAIPIILDALPLRGSRESWTPNPSE